MGLFAKILCQLDRVALRIAKKALTIEHIDFKISNVEGDNA